MSPATAPLSHTMPGHHGAVRGADLNRRSSSFEGRFGRMFRTLPAAEFDEKILLKLGQAMTSAPDDKPTPETEVDDEENTGISAGYTYLGQFIDHDLTFDPASSLERQNDPDALVDFRTPRFDLDSVYGRGPDDQPYLYRTDGLHMLLGAALKGNDNDPNARGLPRNKSDGTEPARALIGDPRNDENVIVSQLQAAMLRFHNRVVDTLDSPTFEEAQRMVRWHYQWVVLYDFLPTIIGKDTWHAILPHTLKGTTVLQDPPQIKFYQPQKDAFMPVEFSVGAYRFGHSMVRPEYRLNLKMKDRLPIFSTTGDSLVGFRQTPDNLAIDWSLFFTMGPASKSGPNRVQPAYKPDTSVVNPLGNLPPSVAANPASLPQRNLLRGWRMGLPSGQAVAAAMGITPIDDDSLRVGKATEADKKTNPKLKDISPLFEENAPLWYYVLAEAQQQFVKDETPIHLGEVGGRIVGEVMVGLLLADSHSFLRQNPLFKPLDAFKSSGGDFKMADLLKQAMKA
ncbi:MAG: heme peroxidase [Acidobacteriia bacterium]|nr:heme peroxidase [Terriglobia bacterium]